MSSRTEKLTLAGFLLPGILHEIRNTLCRIRLLTEPANWSSATEHESRARIEAIRAQVDEDACRWLERLGEYLRGDDPLSSIGSEIITETELAFAFRLLRSACRRSGVEFLSAGRPSARLCCRFSRLLELLGGLCLCCCETGGRGRIEVGIGEPGCHQEWTVTYTPPSGCDSTHMPAQAVRARFGEFGEQSDVSLIDVAEEAGVTKMTLRVACAQKRG